jgi:N-acetylneuraminic acid mutarotase
MRNFFLGFLCAVFLFAASLYAADKETKIPPLPAPVSNNAVVALRGGFDVYSLMGIGPKKTWNDISNQVYVLHLSSGKWAAERPLPGVGGRLGSAAVAFKNEIFLFGGYTVDGQGNELTVPDVNVYRPDIGEWLRGEDMPVAVDSAVIGLDRGRYIYLIGGRSTSGPVNNVQIYDIQKNTWMQAPPFPGTPVFGAAGGLGDATIVLVDGAKKDPKGSGYVPSDDCWMGQIDHKHPERITWSKIPPHPGNARFGIIAGARENDRRIIFSGGSSSVHNFKGLDAQGKPVQLSPVTFDYDVRTNRWETIGETTENPRSDVRGLASTPLGNMIVGGLGNDLSVSSSITILPK